MVTEVKVRRLALLSIMLTGLVGMASAAFSMNSTEVIIGGVTLLFTPILAVVVAGVPVIVTMAIIAFILGILSMILGKLR
jgi:uncharacterized membrane protein (DUF106 family)